MGISVIQGVTLVMMYVALVALAITYWWAILLALLVVAWLVRLYNKRRASRSLEIDQTLFREISEQRADIHEAVGSDFSAFIEGIEVAAEEGSVSAALLRRRLNLSPTMASRITDLLARYEIVSSANGSRPRTLLLPPHRVLLVAQALRGSSPAGD